MATRRHLHTVEAGQSEGTPIAEAIASYLRWLSTKRGRSGQVTSSQTVRSYKAALPVALAGLATVEGLATEEGARRLRTNLAQAWDSKTAATFNAKRVAVVGALSFFAREGWLPADVSPLSGIDREPEPTSADRVRDRAAIDRLITTKSSPLQDRALFSLLYSTAARCEEALQLDVDDLDRPDRRARVIRKGGRPDELMYDTRTAARRLAAATGGWSPHDLRHSRLTHAGEDGATEADLMNLSGHEDRRSLQRYLRPSKEGAHRRLDELDLARGFWNPGADEIAARLAELDHQQLPGQTTVPVPGYDTAPPVETRTETTSTSSLAASGEHQHAPGARNPARSQTSHRRGRYTETEIDNYQLDPLRNDVGQ
ncbi:integrase/recombinase XerC [Actinopolyspora lacussalsi]|nr:integrase/recombinase XerC [Actinopolyspora lacussalsi]